MDDVSLASARRVVLSTYATIEDVISLADSRTEEERIDRLVELAPDVILVAGGTDGGAADRVLQLNETVSLALALMSGQARPPTVLYAGNAELRPAVVEMLEGAAVRSTDNVRPQFDVEYLEPARAEIAAIFEESRLLDLPGAEELRNLADGALVPSAKAFHWTIRYLADVLHHNVIGVDVGGASVTISAVINEQPQLIVRSDLGIGHNLPRLLEQSNPQQILRWYPFKMTNEELGAFVGNKGLAPRTVPTTVEESLLELALARELIRAMLPAGFPNRFDGNGTLPPVELILASGAVLANAARPGQAALALLDALQPVGICTLALDTQNMATILGASSTVLPMTTVQVIEAGAFQELGSVIAPMGYANPGDVVLQLAINYDNGSELEVEVEYGSLEVLPLPPGKTAEVHLKPVKRFDVGAGPGRNSRRRVPGGAVGLIVDARGRPLRLPTNSEERRSQMEQWLWDMGG